MSVRSLFVIGLAVGAALAVVGMQLLGRETPPVPSPGRSEEVSHESCRHRETALRAEVETLRARVRDEEAGPGPAAAATDTSPARSTAARPVETRPVESASTAPGPAASAEDVYRTTLREVRKKLEAVRASEPGSDAILSLIREWRARLDDEDARMARLSTAALKRLAALGKLRPADTDGFVAEYRALPRGARARPGLAAVVTRALAGDARLADWFGGLPPVEEPEIREQVIWALDESPSAAFRDYVLRLSREETSADVLNSLWNEDIVLVTLTRDVAPKLIEAIKGRVARGDLPPRVRGRAYFGIGLAAAHASDHAKEAIDALLTSETDPGVRAFGEGVGKAVEREESNVQALEGLWGRHARSFGN